MKRTRGTGPEFYIKRDIKTFAEMMGFAVYDLEQNRKTRQTPGLADLLLLHDKYKIELWVETKAGKNQPSDAQELFYELVWASGGMVAWCWSIDDFLWILFWLGVGPQPPSEASQKAMEQGNAFAARRIDSTVEVMP